MQLIGPYRRVFDTSLGRCRR